MPTHCDDNIKNIDNTLIQVSNLIRDPNMFYKWFVKFQTDTGYFINPDNRNNINPDFPTYLNGYNNDISGIITCINSQNLTELNNNNTSIQNQISQNIHDMEKRKEDIQIAQDRALLVRNPELSRSYYDGWFSLGRPMHQLSIPIFIGFGTLFMMISLFMILDIMNISTVFTIMIFQDTLNLPFVLVSIVAIILLCITIYAFNR